MVKLGRLKIFHSLLGAWWRANLILSIDFCPQNNVIVTKKHKRYFEVRILSLPLIVFHRPVDEISWRTYLPCAIYWHPYPRDQPQPTPRQNALRMSTKLNIRWGFYFQSSRYTWSYENRVSKHFLILLNFPRIIACLQCCLLMSFLFFCLFCG